MQVKAKDLQPGDKFKRRTRTFEVTGVTEPFVREGRTTQSVTLTFNETFTDRRYKPRWGQAYVTADEIMEVER